MQEAEARGTAHTNSGVADGGLYSLMLLADFNLEGSGSELLPVRPDNRELPVA